MTNSHAPRRFRWLSDYGMLIVLVLLCAMFSVLTYRGQAPSGTAAAAELVDEIVQKHGGKARVLIAVGGHPDDVAFADRLAEGLSAAGATVRTIKGEPGDARKALEEIAWIGSGLDVIACSGSSSSWLVFEDLGSSFPTLGSAQILSPRMGGWPVFLTASNLRNIANQIAVIAILAVGMTFVIIAGGIDLSVGSLVALSAVVAAKLIRDALGATDASLLGMMCACLVSVTLCGAIGLANGMLITWFRMPSFIVTLATMLIASGCAYIISGGQSIFEIPDSFVWLGRGAALFTVPNAVVLMLLLYIVAHVLMSRTTLGRYIYAVGGNREAARLAGVPIQGVLLFAYGSCGLLAGVGGIIMASVHKSAEPSYGVTYELYVIAAAVVGGASLSGGEGKMFGTLIGAFIIAVIQNGMNLTNVEPYTQKVVLGAIILVAVLLDRLKRGQWGTDSEN